MESSPSLREKINAREPLTRRDLLEFVRLLKRRIQAQRLLGDPRAADRKIQGMIALLELYRVQGIFSLCGFKNAPSNLIASLRALRSLCQKEIAGRLKRDQRIRILTVMTNPEMRQLVPIVAKYAHVADDAKIPNLMGPQLDNDEGSWRAQLRWVWRIGLYSLQTMRRRKIPMPNIEDRKQQFLDNNWLYYTVADSPKRFRPLMAFYGISPVDLTRRAGSGHSPLRSLYLEIKDEGEEWDLCGSFTRKELRQVLDFVGPEAIRKAMPELIPPLCVPEIGSRLGLYMPTKLGITHRELLEMILRISDDYSEKYEWTLVCLCQLLYYFPCPH